MFCSCKFSLERNTFKYSKWCNLDNSPINFSTSNASPLLFIYLLSLFLVRGAGVIECIPATSETSSKLKTSLLNSLETVLNPQD